MIRIEQLTKKYTTLSGEVLATDNVNLHFSCNGLYMILGKSGCGKTTLLNILSGLDKYDEGCIYIHGTDIGGFSENELDDYRNLKIGVVFQEYNLIPDLSVFDNLQLVLEIQEWDGKSIEQIKVLIKETLEKVGLDGYESRRINELSGGERQRVAVARALIKRPNIIFADEPTGNLDSKTSNVMFELLSQISKEYVVIVVTHDRDSAFRYGDTVIEMENGHVANVKKQFKEKQNFIYSLSLIKNKGQEEKVELTYDNLGQFLAELVSDAEHQDTITLSSIKVEKDNRVLDDEKKGNKERLNKQSRKLSFYYRLQLAGAFLKKKKLTLLLTTCVLALSLGLFFCAITTTFYQSEKSITLYMNTYQPKLIPVYAEKSYCDSFYQTYSQTLTKGGYLSALLEEILPESIKKVEAIYDCEFYKLTDDEYSTDYAYGVTTLYAPNEYMESASIEGEYPQNNNECLITDYLSSELGVKIGDVISNHHQELKVTGIIQTDYIGYQLKMKILHGSDSPYVEYYLRYRYNVVCCRSQLLHEDMPQSNNRIMLAMSDFTTSSKEISYRESNFYYDSVQNINQENLIAGRMPQADNEVLVSESFMFLKNLEMNLSKFEPFFGEFVDIQQEKFNECHSMNLDLSDFFPQGITVVGVVSGVDLETLNADVYVSERIWGEIAQLYYDQYAASVLCYVSEGDYGTLVQELTRNSLRIEEPAVIRIYEFSDTLNVMRAFLVTLLIVIILLCGIMLANFIHISMRSNKRNIGILRALGISMKDISGLFTIESWTVYGLSVLLSVPVVLIIQNIANNIYLEGIKENPHNIISWNWTAEMVVLVVGTIVCFFALQVPLRKLKKSKLIELIR